MWKWPWDKKEVKPTSGELIIKHIQAQLPDSVFIIDDTESMPKDAKYDHRITFVVNGQARRIEFSDNSEHDGELDEDDKRSVERTLMISALEALHKDMGEKRDDIQNKLKELRE